MNLSGNKGRIMGAAKELSLQWNQTKNYWRDAKSREFERRYMQELHASLDKALAVIDKLDELLKKVRSDCE
jgi:ribosome-binding factor A